MRNAHSKTILGKLLGVSLIVSLFSLAGGAGLSFVAHAQAFNASIMSRSVQLSSSVPGATTTYRIAFTSPAQPLLGSIKIEFCENTPLFGVPCDPPAGFDLSGATLSDQSGEVGFSKYAGSTANMLILSRVPIASQGDASVYTLSGVHSASAVGTQYARYSTYSESDASGAIVDMGGVAYALNDGYGVTTEVPPHIDFCVGTSIPTNDCGDASGNYLSLGDFSTAAAVTGQTQMLVSTNAANGYVISVDGHTMTSGNNTIPALTVPTVSAPGVSQFGINLVRNSNPAGGQDPSGPGSGNPTPAYGTSDRYMFNPGDVIAGYNNSENFRKYTVSYLVNIGRDQPAGVYASTYTYIALGHF